MSKQQEEKWEVNDWDDDDFFDHGYGLINELSYDYLVLLAAVQPPAVPPSVGACDTTDTLFAGMMREEILERERSAKRPVKIIQLGRLYGKEDKSTEVVN